MSRLHTHVLILVLTLILPAICFADFARDFENTISIERSLDGKITKILLKKANSRQFTEEDMFKHFIDELDEVQTQIRATGSYGLIEDSLDLKDWPERERKIAEDALDLLRRHDLKPILSHPEVKKAMNLLTQESNSDMFNFRVLAVPENSKYYDSNEKTVNVLMQASGLVKLALGSSFGVTIALFFIKSSYDMIIERRSYFQNYLIYQLDKHGPEKFGLTQEEGNKIKSSIFESRIRWWEFWEKTRARADWDKYGQTKHLNDLVAADKRRKAENLELQTWGVPMGFAFHDGDANGNKKVVNLVTPRSVISRKLSYGFDYSSPEKIRLERVLYYVLQLGMRFAPVPAVSTLFDFFVESFYVPQRQMEGVLYGFFRDSEAYEQAHQIARQSINPFIITEVANKNF